MDSLTFLERPPKGKPQPLYVLHGDQNPNRDIYLLVLKP